MYIETIWDLDLPEARGVSSLEENALNVDVGSLPSILTTSSSRKRRDLLLQFINQMVAVAFEMKPADLIEGERGNLRRTRARQISMYLMNISLARNFIEIADYYGRDRTTVSHACRVIESLRDIPAFDDRLIEFENTVSLVLSLSGSVGLGGRP